MVEKLQEFEETIDPIVQLFEDPEVQEYLEQKKLVWHKISSLLFFFLPFLSLLYLISSLPIIFPSPSLLSFLPLSLFFFLPPSVVTLFSSSLPPFSILSYFTLLSPSISLRENLTLFEYLSQNHDVSPHSCCERADLVVSTG